MTLKILSPKHLYIRKYLEVAFGHFSNGDMGAVPLC